MLYVHAGKKQPASPKGHHTGRPVFHISAVCAGHPAPSNLLFTAASDAAGDTITRLSWVAFLFAGCQLCKRMHWGSSSSAAHHGAWHNFGEGLLRIVGCWCDSRGVLQVQVGGGPRVRPCPAARPLAAGGHCRALCRAPGERCCFLLTGSVQPPSRNLVCNSAAQGATVPARQERNPASQYSYKQLSAHDVCTTCCCGRTRRRRRASRSQPPMTGRPAAHLRSPPAGGCPPQHMPACE